MREKCLRKLADLQLEKIDRDRPKNTVIENCEKDYGIVQKL